MAQAFSSLEKLSRLSLNRNKLGDGAASELATILKSHPSLVTIKLQNNSIGCDLSLNLPSSLSIKSYKCTVIGTAGAVAIFEALKTNNSVTHINLSFNQVSNDALRYLGSSESNAHR